MKKFLKVVLVLVLAVTPLFSMVAYAYSIGNEITFQLTLPAAGVNKKLATGQKKNDDYKYACVRLYGSSTYNQANFWIENENGVKISEKVDIEDDGHAHKLNYKDGEALYEGDKVVFFGEQYNIASKTANGVAYPY